MVRREKPTGEKEREKREERETDWEREEKREREREEGDRRKQGERQSERETETQRGWFALVNYRSLPANDSTVTIHDQCGYDIGQGARGDPCCFEPRGRPEWHELVPNRQGWGVGVTRQDGCN